MDNVGRLILRAIPAEKKEKTRPDSGKLLEEIREVSRLLACNEVWFQQECDENLIDSCIYQRESLQARYRFLLNQAKKQGLCCAPFQK